MSDNNKGSLNKPVFDVFVVEDRGENKDDFWLKVGAAFPHSDKDGMTITLQALPTNGRLVLRRVKKKEEEKQL